jgi:hypothetical protein
MSCARKNMARDKAEELARDGRILLNWILNKCVMAWTGFTWFRVEKRVGPGEQGN